MTLDRAIELRDERRHDLREAKDRRPLEWVESYQTAGEVGNDCRDARGHGGVSSIWHGVK